mgnify:FL=1
MRIDREKLFLECLVDFPVCLSACALELDFEGDMNGISLFFGEEIMVGQRQAGAVNGCFQITLVLAFLRI